MFLVEIELPHFFPFVPSSCSSQLLSLEHIYMCMHTHIYSLLSISLLFVCDSFKADYSALDKQ